MKTCYSTLFSGQIYKNKITPLLKFMFCHFYSLLKQFGHLFKSVTFLQSGTPNGKKNNFEKK